MIKFRNISDDDRDVGATSVRGGLLVEKGQVYEVAGEVVEETDDAYIVADDSRATVVSYEDPDAEGRARPVTEPSRTAWPKSTWKLVGDVRRRDAATGEPVKASDTKSDGKGDAA